MPRAVDSVELFEVVVCIGLSKNYDRMRGVRGREKERGREGERKGGREERRKEERREKSVHKFSSSQATGPSIHLPAPT